jgi:hypothetical protein
MKKNDRDLAKEQGSAMKWLSEEHKPSWHENTYDYAEYS